MYFTSNWTLSVISAANPWSIAKCFEGYYVQLDLIHFHVQLYVNYISFFCFWRLNLSRTPFCIESIEVTIEAMVAMM